MPTFTSIRKYVYDRRRGIFTTVAFVGGAYLAGHYALRRLEEMRERLIDDKTSKENLRQRFIRSQEDCIFTSQALVPTFGIQILEYLDVEALTLELQQHGTKPSTKAVSSHPNGSQTVSGYDLGTPASAGSPAATHSAERSLDSGSPSGSREAAPDGQHGDPAQSWVQEFTGSQVQAPENLPLPPPTSQEASSPTKSSAQGDPTGSISGRSEAESESISGSSIIGLQIEESLLQAPVLVQAPSPISSKTKAQMWKELRAMTFTRTLTLIYTTALLSLQTHIQLNILASHKYVQSVFEMEEEERARDSWSFFGGILGSKSEERERPAPISEMTERKYLTMNWWLLNVGWKDILERVQKAVEEVFGSIPLKSELTASQLRSHLDEVRRKVEYDGLRAAQPEEDEELSNAEQERLQGVSDGEAHPDVERTDFLPALLPLTWATEQQALLAGGFSPDAVLSDPTPDDAKAFKSLMDQSKTLIQSKDFELVLNKALGFSIDLFMDYMEQNVIPVPEKAEEGEEGRVEEGRIRLAAMLPGVARWSHTAVMGMPNALIEGISHLPEVSAFSAIIFSSYEELVRGEEDS